MFELLVPHEFEWNRGNSEKNWIKHGVRNKECEEVFLDPSKRLFFDPIHSEREDRYVVLGKTEQQRLLFVVFTVRGKSIRIISARDAKQKERQRYEEAT